MSDWYDASDGDAWKEPVNEGDAADTWNDPVDEGEVGGREDGVVKRWSDKGFGFIERNNGRGSVFCHASDCPGRLALAPGSKVSFVFETDAKGGKAKEVQIEEAAAEADFSGARETGTIKTWNAEKGFGFVGRSSGEPDAFVHKRECGGIDFVKGQAVSFVVGEGPKGASAKDVRPEDGGTVEEAVVEEDESERQLGKVKSYNEEKGFAFITPCTGGEDLFSHKKEFGGIVPAVGMPVSYIEETTDKGNAAKKVREEESVPEPKLSDEGREFGKVKNFLLEKGFGFINWKGEEPAIVFDKETNGLALEKDMCVSFKYEEGAKGPLAKDVRQEDPDRVARITAKIHYGKVKMYCDPTEKKPTNGYGFITPLKKPGYGEPEKYDI
ncbi:hypothetical protein ACLMJK_000754 [Lecanora helva]